MRSIIKILLVTASLSVGQSLMAAPLKILVLGDSITASYGEGKSYRYLLQDKMAGQSFEFIGSKSGDDGTDRPGYQNAHEGHPGAYTSSFLGTGDSTTNNQTLQQLLSGYYAPDVALIHLGTNDAIDARNFSSGDIPSLVDVSIDNMNAIIATLRTEGNNNGNPDIKIFLSQIIPLASNYNDDGSSGGGNGAFVNNSFINPLNNKIAEIAAADSNIFAVNMYAGFLNGDDNTLFEDDGIHPIQAGEQILADGFYGALVDANIVSAVPLPPAIYLFGAAMVSLFRFGRRKQ